MEPANEGRQEILEDMLTLTNKKYTRSYLLKKKMFLSPIILVLCAFFAPIGIGMNILVGFDISKVFVGSCFLLILHWLLFSRHKFDVFPKVYNYFILYIIIHTIVVYTLFVPEEFNFGYLGETAVGSEGFAIKEESRSLEVFRIFLLVFFAYAVASFMKTKKRLIAFALAYGIGSFFTSVFGYLCVTSQSGEVTQFCGGFYNPNFFGASALTAVWLNLSVVLMPKQKAWIRIMAMLLVLTALVAILRSISRGAMLALFVGVVCMVLFLPNVKRKLQIIILACLLGAGFFLAMPDSLAEDIYARVNLDQVKEKGGSYRLAIWSEYLSGYPKYVLMGTGIKRSTTVIQDSAPQILKSKKTHNTYLETLVEFGIVGFLLFLIALWFIWQKLVMLRSGRKLLVDAVFMGYFVSWLTIMFFYNHYGSRCLWLSFGIIAAFFQQNLMTIKGTAELNSFVEEGKKVV